MYRVVLGGLGVVFSLLLFYLVHTAQLEPCGRRMFAIKATAPGAEKTSSHQKGVPVMQSISNLLDDEMDFMFLNDALDYDNSLNKPLKVVAEKGENVHQVTDEGTDDNGTIRTSDISEEGSGDFNRGDFVGSRHIDKVKPSKGTGKKRGTAVDRRRERNRVLARKTRLRKKFFFESLQMQVTQLAQENKNLKCVVRDKILKEDIRDQILSECKVEIPVLLTTSKITDYTKNSNSQQQNLSSVDFDLINIIHAAQRSFVITNPSLPDNPIMFASPGFLELSGYDLHDVIGRNCRFMQGPDTDPTEVAKLRNGIANCEDVSVILVNYKKDGTAFHNQIYLAGLKNSNGKVVNYVGVQAEVKAVQKVSREESFNEALEQASALLNNFPNPKRGRPRGKTGSRTSSKSAKKADLEDKDISLSVEGIVNNQEEGIVGNAAVSVSDSFLQIPVISNTPEVHINEDPTTIAAVIDDIF